LHSILIVQKKNKVVNAPCFALVLAWCGVVQTPTISPRVQALVTAATEQTEEETK
jgi:hypothetical protein